MKRKASLVLVELLIMLAVFAVAASLCLRAFVWSDNQAKQSAVADFALMQTQNVAETLKHYRGDYSTAAQTYGGQWDGNAWRISYDDDWGINEETQTYSLCVLPISGEISGLGRARLTLVDREGSVLTDLYVSWQEVER